MAMESNGVAAETEKQQQAKLAFGGVLHWPSRAVLFGILRVGPACVALPARTSVCLNSRAFTSLWGGAGSSEVC
jgi:hypothetical protein